MLRYRWGDYLAENGQYIARYEMSRFHVHPKVTDIGNMYGFYLCRPGGALHSSPWKIGLPNADVAFARYTRQSWRL